MLSGSIISVFIEGPAFSEVLAVSSLVPDTALAREEDTGDFPLFFCFRLVAGLSRCSTTTMPSSSVIMRCKGNGSLSTNLTVPNRPDVRRVRAEIGTGGGGGDSDGI